MLIFFHKNLQNPFASIENVQRSRWKAVGLYVLQLILPAIFFSMVLAIGFAFFSAANPANVAMISTIITYLTTLLCYRWFFKEWPHKIIGDLRKSDIKLILVLYAVLLLGNIMIGLIPSGPAQNQEALIHMFDLGSPWLFFIHTVLLAPLVEEILYRRVFFNGLMHGVNGWVAIGLNIIVFTLLHTGTFVFVNPAATLQYAWLSLVFVLSYALTRRLSVAVAFHFFNNAIAFTALSITYLM